MALDYLRQRINDSIIKFGAVSHLHLIEDYGLNRRDDVLLRSPRRQRWLALYGLSADFQSTLRRAGRDTSAYQTRTNYDAGDRVNLGFYEHIVNPANGRSFDLVVMLDRSEPDIFHISAAAFDQAKQPLAQWDTQTSTQEILAHLFPQSSLAAIAQVFLSIASPALIEPTPPTI